ncbi:Galectin, carbohydrate recognition domain and Concanavalin A-like lectin/glucanases superfamily domain and Concanavalin A-like lectin/glucanase, subgroup domain-containing protein [Strongyloides ratti]|uniref:Galectin n=1 Tax=Strongyloides ratti TaxID=34506 RepID=A0A090LFN2_STRRB|nr:Galectin, carbohydrate recognition domain and Concanavalin A-like lectin/glucanases superfamily domain and Concanavalin A-like lectin/glucanase, subgroup domain-containing protein [Strongyloides ratti]CEF66290.1 Galectin, carbohydrate recognition domain and Concanavalin A-like lectin/glucanases superfamily domain and Concanavalin A-like lectin/glucanase, subgroup domain-containing protein [Strongyloides ratti]
MGIGDGVTLSFSKEEYNPSVPFSTSINGFATPQHIRIIGQCQKHAKRFYINFSNDSDIVFHFNVRFDEKCVVRNSTENGSWLEEERFEDSFPFHHCKIFTLDFIANENYVECKYDGQFFTEFSYRKWHTNVSSMEIQGDVELHYISVHKD